MSAITDNQWENVKADAAAARDIVKYAALLALAREMCDAMERTYDATEWPANGTSRVELAAKKFREFEQQSS